MRNHKSGSGRTSDQFKYICNIRACKLRNRKVRLAGLPHLKEILSARAGANAFMHARYVYRT